MKIKKLEFAEFGLSTTTNLLPAGQASKQQRIDYIKRTPLYVGVVASKGGLMTRIMTPMCYRVPRQPRRRLLMVDCVTGSIYNPRDGACLSSSGLKLIDCVKDQELAKEILLSIKFGDLK